MTTESDKFAQCCCCSGIFPRELICMAPRYGDGYVCFSCYDELYDELDEEEELEE